MKIAKNAITGLFYSAQTKAFTATEAEATKLDPQEVAAIRYCFLNPEFIDVSPRGGDKKRVEYLAAVERKDKDVEFLKNAIKVVKAVDPQTVTTSKGLIAALADAQITVGDRITGIMKSTYVFSTASDGDYVMRFRTKCRDDEFLLPKDMGRLLKRITDDLKVELEDSELTASAARNELKAVDEEIAGGANEYRYEAGAYYAPFLFLGKEVRIHYRKGQWVTRIAVGGGTDQYVAIGALKDLLSGL